MSDPLAQALALAVLLSILIAIIDVCSQAKVTDVRVSLSGAFFLYMLIVVIGNSAATLLGSTMVGEKLPAALQPWAPFLFAFFGVFAFQGILGNTNITMFGKGVLTIEAWISKARDAATATAVARGAQRAMDRMMKAASLLVKLSDNVLNAHVDQHLGAGTAAQLDADAQKSGKDGADPKLYKALELARRKPNEADSIIKANRL